MNVCLSMNIYVYHQENLILLMNMSSYSFMGVSPIFTKSDKFAQASNFRRATLKLINATYLESPG